MIRYKKFIIRFLASLILIGFISNNSAFAQGEALFKSQCANCHKPNQDYTGPALAGARKREPSADWVYKRWLISARMAIIRSLNYQWWYFDYLPLTSPVNYFKNGYDVLNIHTNFSFAYRL